MKLQAENITKLCNGKKVLDQLQLTLEKGKIYGLTGRIGVGKTTLFSILSKQLLPDAGTVHLYDDNGRELELTLGRVFFRRIFRPYRKKTRRPEPFRLFPGAVTHLPRLGQQSGGNAGRPLSAFPGQKTGRAVKRHDVHDIHYCRPGEQS
ncbi:MAG: ATP-binding cassette domain-containing protein [Eisenbergiella massiliensis]